ncbi:MULTISPECIES: DUF924 family protein [Comamonas]|uniref:DUF924 domain-containing protein n=1 Tax=Comamonas squillarum TaxID=2977320 RepID=A0ABY5ZW30_9BURK|nr:DUF924 family protein [Comamonas sp. PR12]UXC17529.1 DUF924 domain-containing protein [Comamonas sp. PR12]
MTSASASAPAPAPAPIASADEVLQFWLGSARPSNSEALQHKQQWFSKSDAFDARIRTHFGATVQAALKGDLPGWTEGVWDTLARIIVLDQFTRNIYRGTPESFAGDPLALQLALGLCDSGQDQALPAVVRVFVYLPLEHAEDAALQQRSVDLVAQLRDSHPEPAELQTYLQGTWDYALRHQAVITRFGRFPHRNAILGRRSTAEELHYLAQPGAGF